MTSKFDLALLPAEPDFHYEQALWKAGVQFVAGIDEAGRGPIAGPVSAAALILPAEPELSQSLKGVRDSKQMTAAEREFWAVRLKTCAVSWGVGFGSSQEIDLLGIMPAIFLAVQRALDQLQHPPQHLLIDYLKLPNCIYPQTALVKGDARSLSIAAASILAKVHRDVLLTEFDDLYPGYGFASHKGYCTPQHLKALQRMGFCPIHRQSFRPVNEAGRLHKLVEENDE
jgi:ribonuclease HII